MDNSDVNHNYNYVDKEYAEPEVLDIYLDPLQRGAVAVLNNIFFDYNSFDLRVKSLTELGEVVRLLQENPELEVEIGGHTDDVGSNSFNQELSVNRAHSVMDHLIANQIDPLRIRIKGYGASRPLVANDSEENRARNRRIEFKILWLSGYANPTPCFGWGL